MNESLCAFRFDHFPPSVLSPGVILRSLLLLSVLISACTPAPEPVPLTRPPVHHVIAIPGLFDSSARFKQFERTLSGQPQRLHLFEPSDTSGATPIPRLGQELARFLEEKCAPQDTVSLVGFSMGGLIARSYLQNEPRAVPVRQLITIGTPNEGTIAALLSAKPAIAQMRAGSDFLTDLNGRTYSRLDGIDCLAIWTQNDLVVLPARNALLRGKRQVEVNVPGHRNLMSSPQTLTLIQEEISKASPLRADGLLPR